MATLISVLVASTAYFGYRLLRAERASRRWRLRAIFAEDQCAAYRQHCRQVNAKLGRLADCLERERDRRAGLEGAD